MGQEVKQLDNHHFARYNILMSPLTTTLAAVMYHMLKDLYSQRADRIKIENSFFDYLHQQRNDLKTCDAYWQYDQDNFIVEFKTTDSEQFYVLSQTFSYLSHQPQLNVAANPADDYDRAMRGI
jgi:hypothetical protein